MATAAYSTECVLELGSGWVNARKLEQMLRAAGDALGGAFTGVVIRFAAGCKLMIDVVIRLLSFCNQVIAMTKRLRLHFEGGEQGIRGYLSRMGFFDCLSPQAEVVPTRPLFSGAVLHRGCNHGLVEIERFSRSAAADRNLPDRLAKALERGCTNRADVKEATKAIANITSELVGNVFDHSETGLDAYAALQTYPQGNRVTIAVSDSGKGIMGTLRPALQRRGSPLSTLNDTELLVETFRQGISSLDDDKHGNGLMSCARSAIRYKADLDVRLLRDRVLLRPSDGIYRANTAYSQEGLSLLWGTHIAFSLQLS